MSKSFPLYDRLLKNVRENSDPYSYVDLEPLALTISNIPKQMDSVSSHKHLFNIAGLMFHHEVITNGMPLTPTVFNTKIFPGGKGLIVTVKNLPKTLQQIIAEYIKENSI